MSRRRDWKEDDSLDECELCTHTREDHEDNFGKCELCGCRKFWVDADEMRAFDRDEQ